MIKTDLTLLLLFVFNGFLDAQDIDSKKCECDSILMTKIECRAIFALVGRTVKTLVSPDNNTCEIGTYSIDILVNRNGEVVQAVFNTKISSPISDTLKTILIDATMKVKFINNEDAPLKQKGNITYHFEMKDEMSMLGKHQ